MRRHLLVHRHLSCLLVCSRLMRPRLLSRTLPPFLRPRNSELESKLVSLDDIINRCDYYVFFELNKRSFNKILNAKNIEPKRCEQRPGMTSLVPFSALLGRATKNAHFKNSLKSRVLINCKNFYGIFPNSMQRFHDAKKHFLGL